MKIKPLYLPVLLALFCFCLPVSVKAEPDLLSKLQSSSYRARLDTLKVIERDALYQEEATAYLNDRLQKTVSQGWLSSKEADETAWMCKAIAASGKQEVVDLLAEAAKMASNPNVKNHCNKAIEQIEFYRQRRSVLHADTPVEGLSPELELAVNLVNSGDEMMMRDGAKRIFRSHEANEQVYDIVHAALMNGVATKQFDSASVDAYAWLCKCLGNSGLGKYRTDLIELASTTMDWKVKSYAEKAAEELSD